MPRKFTAADVAAAFGVPLTQVEARLPKRKGPKVPLFRAQIGSSEPDDDGVVTMRLYDVISSNGGDWGISASEVAAALDDVQDAKEIRLHINSPGGAVWEAIAITNQFRQHPADVTAVVDSLAASAASFIACAANTLVMSPNAELMIHDAWGLCIGNASDMADTSDRLNRMSDNIASIYQAKGGGTVADWRQAMLAESWYRDSEAVDAGLADRVDGAEADDEPEARAAFDLSRFKYEGRAKAPKPTMPAAHVDEPSTTSDLRARHSASRHRLAAARHGLPL